jgi:hypothetical protein
MNRAQTTGKLLIVGAAIEMLLFLIGVARRSYLALALPVMAAMAALTALTVWIGWTMLSLEEEDDEPAVAPPATPPTE